MDTVIFGNFTLWQLLNYAWIVLVVLILYWALKGILKKTKKSHHYQVSVCEHCGWQGEVSVYAGKCPKCNRPLSARKIDEF